MILGLWEHFRENKISYYTSGNQGTAHAELGNASNVQDWWEKHKVLI